MSQGNSGFSTPDVIRSTFKNQKENVKVLLITSGVENLIFGAVAELAASKYGIRLYPSPT
jgi:hypothetical protein